MADRSKLVEEDAARIHLYDVVEGWLGRRGNILCKANHNVKIGCKSSVEFFESICSQLCQQLLHGYGWEKIVVMGGRKLGGVAGWRIEFGSGSCPPHGPLTHLASRQGANRRQSSYCIAHHRHQPYPQHHNLLSTGHTTTVTL